MIKGSKNFFKRKALHDFDAFFNSESIDYFVFRYIIQFLK